MFTDTHLCSRSRAALSAFCASFPNVIGPLPGRVAFAASVDSNGNAIPARAAAGDPATWYAAIRSAEPLAPPSDISICDAATAREVLGVWA